MTSKMDLSNSQAQRGTQMNTIHAQVPAKKPDLPSEDELIIIAPLFSITASWNGEQLGCHGGSGGRTRLERKSSLGSSHFGNSHWPPWVSHENRWSIWIYAKIFQRIRKDSWEPRKPAVNPQPLLQARTSSQSLQPAGSLGQQNRGGFEPRLSGITRWREGQRTRLLMQETEWGARSTLGSGRFPGKRKWQPTPVFLPGKISRTEELSKLQSLGLQRMGHNWSYLAHAPLSWDSQKLRDERS